MLFWSVWGCCGGVLLDCCKYLFVLVVFMLWMRFLDCFCCFLLLFVVFRCFFLIFVIFGGFLLMLFVVFCFLFFDVFCYFLLLVDVLLSSANVCLCLQFVFACGRPYFVPLTLQYCPSLPRACLPTCLLAYLSAYLPTYLPT